MTVLTNEQIHKLYSNALAIKALSKGEAVQYLKSGGGWTYSKGAGPGTSNLIASTYRPGDGRKGAYSVRRIDEAKSLDSNAAAIKAIDSGMAVEFRRKNYTCAVWTNSSNNISISGLLTLEYRSLGTYVKTAENPPPIIDIYEGGHLTQPQKEIPMSIKFTDSVLSIDYLFGEKLEKVSDQEIMDRIVELRQEISAFPDITSANIAKRIATLEEAVKGLILILDSEDRVKDL
jgi:hypothetical protein